LGVLRFVSLLKSFVRVSSVSFHLQATSKAFLAHTKKFIVTTPETWHCELKIFSENNGEEEFSKKLSLVFVFFMP
jgi:hypothetical protein